MEGSRTVNVQNFGKIEFKGYLYMDINRTISDFIFLISKKKTALRVYRLNGDFNPKSAIISKNTNKKKFFFRFLKLLSSEMDQAESRLIR